VGTLSVVRRTKLLLLGLTWLGLLAAAPAASAVNLRYWGGPVATSMNVNVVEWGSDVNPEYTSPSTGDPAFFNYLASQSGTTGDLGGVLAQYMDTAEANAQNQLSYGGLHEITPPSTGGVSGCTLPTCVDDSVIQSELQSDISANTLPAPAANGLQTMYVVLFPPGTNVCQNGDCAYGSSTSSGFCAYHGSFELPSSTTQVLYAPIVDAGSGTRLAGECGSSGSDVANQTNIISHEVAETITDPLVAEASSRNGPPMAWYDSRNGEVADICVSTNDAAANGPWTVQKVWSNLDQNCVAGESAYSAPTASFVADQQASTGEPVNFDASASTDPGSNSASATYARTSYSIGSGLASYSWNWGDGSPPTSSSSPTATHSYANPGNYEVSLTVRDNLGFTSTLTQEIAVTGTGQQAPVVTTGAASGIDSQNATLSGTIDPENQSVQYQFVYGTSANALTNSTQLTPGPATAGTVSADLSGLTPSTTYYYALQVVAGGQTYTGSVQSFTTDPAAAPPAPVQSPQASTGGIAQLTSSSAQLQGAVNPDGGAAVTYWFAYGSSPGNLSQSTPPGTEPGGSAFAPVSANLSGLAPGATYYYALRVNLDGSTTSGAVDALTTLNPAPSVATGPASNVTSSGAAVAGTVNPNGESTTYQVQFGPSTGYGYSSASVSAGSGTASQHVSVSLSGLKPGTTYHYRFVASDAGGTVVGGDATFTTARAPAPAPRLTFRVLGRPALPRVLGRGVRVRFTCNQACVAKFSVIALPGNRLLRVGSVAVSIASGTGRLRAQGSATAVLSFSGKVRKRLARATILRLSIFGVAASSGTATSSPARRLLTLHRRT
jgi:PKD repeat protein